MNSQKNNDRSFFKEGDFGLIVKILIFGYLSLSAQSEAQYYQRFAF